jgi:sigma-B regulation protein RsbU (phosphoserine phosphatase)
MPMNQQGLSFRLNTLITTVAIVIIASIVYLNYHFSNRVLFAKIEESAINQSNLVISKISRITVAAEEIARNVAFQVSYFMKDEQLKPFVREVLQTNAILENLHVIYFGGKQGENLVYSANSNGNQHYYQGQKLSEEFFRSLNVFADPQKPGYWSEPYYDENDSGNLVVSYIMPIRNPKLPKIDGIVSCEISLRKMQQTLQQIPIGEGGYAFITDKTGRLLTYPNPEWINRKNLFEKPSIIFEKNLDKIEADIRLGRRGFGFGNSQYLNNQKAWYYFSPLRDSNWMVVIVYPEKELFRELGFIFRKITWISALGIFVLFLINMIIFRRTLEPLARVTSAIQRFTSPSGKEKPVKNEIKMLAESLENWQSKYGLMIKEQTQTAHEKMKIEKDLQNAREIQFNIIPSGRPDFKQDKKVDLYAILNPAETVGGDLYDYFFIDRNHLLVAIGDVSGKGIPASLFMAIVSTLIKTRAKICSAKDIVAQVNHELSTRNANQYFVTLFLGVFDMDTGVLDYCNAAHNFPYILDENGTFQTLSESHGLPLGIYKDKPFRSSSVRLKTNDSLIIYTDGVINSTDLNHQQYGIKRLEKNLNGLIGLTAEEIVGKLLKSVKLFEAGSHQSDDIAILAMKYLNEKARD